MRDRARVAGRMLLLDQAQRVLLVHERVDVGSAATHWLAPGGGLEAGESAAQAACRELAEETGYTVEVPHAAPMLVLQDRYQLAGVWWCQTNQFFLTRLAGTPVASAAPKPTDLERRLALGVRWWSAAELASTTEVINPPELIGLIARLAGPGGSTPLGDRA